MWRVREARTFQRIGSKQRILGSVLGPRVGDRTARQQGWDCGGLEALEKVPLAPSQKEEAPRPSGLCI